MNITPLSKGVLVGAVLSFIGLEGFDDPAWWIAMISLNAIANLPEIKL